MPVRWAALLSAAVRDRTRHLGHDQVTLQVAAAGQRGKDKEGGIYVSNNSAACWSKLYD